MGYIHITIKWNKLIKHNFIIYKKAVKKLRINNFFTVFFAKIESAIQYEKIR